MYAIQRLEIINSYIFEEDNYGNKYFSPQNGEKQKRLYAEEMEDLKIQELHAAFTKKVEIEAQQEFSQKRAIQLKTTEKIVNLENSSCIKNKSNEMTLCTRKTSTQTF